MSHTKRLLLTERAFKEADIKIFGTYDQLIPCYDIEPVEKITDVVSLFVFCSVLSPLMTCLQYLNQFLFFKANKQVHFHFGRAGHVFVSRASDDSS